MLSGWPTDATKICQKSKFGELIKLSGAASARPTSQCQSEKSGCSHRSGSRQRRRGRLAIEMDLTSGGSILEADIVNLSQIEVLAGDLEAEKDARRRQGRLRGAS